MWLLHFFFFKQTGYIDVIGVLSKLCFQDRWYLATGRSRNKQKNTQQRNWMEMCIRRLCGKLTIRCLPWGGCPSRQEDAPIGHHLVKLAVRNLIKHSLCGFASLSSELFLWALFQMDTWDESKGFGRRSIWLARLPSLVSFPLPWCLLKLRRLWCLLASNSRTHSIIVLCIPLNSSPLKPPPPSVWTLPVDSMHTCLQSGVI